MGGTVSTRAPPPPTKATQTFKVLPFKECREAVGEGLGLRTLECGEGSPWPAVARPGVADWLSQNKEEGQTFDQFWEQTQSSAFSPSHSKNKKNQVVYILPTPDVSPAAVAVLREMLGAFLHPLKVQSLSALTGFESVPKKIYQWSKKPHMSVDDLLKSPGVEAAGKDPNGDMVALLVLTATDLFTVNPETKEDEIALGFSSPSSRTACVSLARLAPSFYGGARCAPKNAEEKKRQEAAFYSRAQKLCSHYILSALLFRRCVYFNCCMNGAFSHELDQRFVFLCPVDLRKFLELVKGFASSSSLDALAQKRYELMKIHFQNRVPGSDMTWLDRRISFLSGGSANSVGSGETKDGKVDSLEVVSTDRAKRATFLKTDTDAEGSNSLVDLSKWVIGQTVPLQDTYTIGKPIGTPGAFGQAFLVTLKATGEERVVKIISKQRFHNDKNRADHFEQLRNEIAIMKKAKHPNVITFFKVFESVADLSIVMEKCGGGELFDRIQELGHYSEKSASGVLKQIMEGVQYLHSQRIAHCDLKPDNFLFLTKSPDSPLKIIDFGMSKHVQRGTFLTKFRGTPYYVAPEVLGGKYSEHCDIWSFGVIMFVCLFGFPPFHGSDNNVIFDKIEHGFINETKPGYGAYFPDSIPASDSAKDLIAKCLNKNIAKRLTATEVLDHPWFHGSASTTPTMEIVAKNLSSFIASTTFKMEVLAHMVDIMERDELKSLGTVFAEIDVNGDGLISSEELIAAFKKQGVDDAKVFSRVEQMMKSADVDGDGMLSYDELLLASVQRKLAAKEERLWQAFCKFDVNLDGKISAVEISKVLGITPAEAQNMVKEIDRNGDGQIDYDEFNKMMLQKEERQLSVLKDPPKQQNPKSRARTTFLQTDVDVAHPELVDLSKWVIGKTVKIEDTYEIGKPIGTPGAFGQAFLAIYKPTGEERVVKMISKQKFHNDDQRLDHFEQLRNEIAIMRKAKHPNIVQYFKVFETQAEVQIVMECLRGGELFDKIQELGHYSEQGASEVLSQIMKGILYLHSQRIAHCDLKPDNFLFLEKKEQSPIKIIDFGMSKLLKKGTFLTKFRGTPYYVAPEVIKGKYVEHCDIWSFGVIMFICLFGFPPFHGNDNDEIFGKVAKGFKKTTAPGYGAYFPDSIPCSEAAKDLIASCLEMDVARRLTAAEVLDHPWFNGKASATPTIDVVAKNLSSFVATNKFKLEVLQIMSDLMPKDELKALATLFREIDVNGDGRISPDELVAALKKQGVEDEKVLARSASAIKAADVDGDGSLSYNELLLASVERKLLAKEERLWQAFCKFDKNLDGSLTGSEIAQVLGISPQEAAALIKDVDVNKDGVISYEEFNKLMLAKEQQTMDGIIQPRKT